MGNLLSNKDGMMNEVNNILMQYQATKTGYNSLFTGIKDFRVDELEMLEFLFENCPETVKILEQECKKYQQEFNKPSNISWLLMQTTFKLNKIYHFGWLNSKKVEVLDTITDIAQIPMKERYTTYLNKLRVVKPEIDVMFVEAYNQCQPHLNILRVEQCFSYLREELEYQGIQTDYGDYAVACPHGVGRPYFSRTNYGYYIVDNNGHYNGNLFLINKNLEKNQPLEWWYTSSINPDAWHTNKALAEVKVEQLRELRELAGLENIDWQVIYANHHDLRQQNSLNHKNEIVEIEIPKGSIGKYRTVVKQIDNKYKPIIKAVCEAFRKSPVGMAI